MANGDPVLQAMREYSDAHPEEPALPQAFVMQLLKDRERLARESEQMKEREELVCRLLASGMTVDELSIILKIRKEEISIIEHNNAAVRIPDYTKKLNARRKSRERR